MQYAKSYCKNHKSARANSVFFFRFLVFVFSFAYEFSVRHENDVLITWNWDFNPFQRSQSQNVIHNLEFSENVNGTGARILNLLTTHVMLPGFRLFFLFSFVYYLAWLFLPCSHLSSDMTVDCMNEMRSKSQLINI